MKGILVFLSCLLAGITLWANGDPVATFCALTLSRNPVGKHVPEVQLKDEHLTVTPLGRYTLVRVEYILWNNSKKDFHHLAYGFPVDYYRQGNELWAGVDAYSESVRESGWRDNYISEVCFSLDGIQLPFQASGDTLLRKGQTLLTPEENAADTTGELWEERAEALEVSLYEYSSDLMRRWYYTFLDIPAGKAVKLFVQYRIENLTHTSLSSKDALLKFPETQGHFAYDFSPASYWGNGKAETFEVLVDGRQIGLNHINEIPETQTIHGLPMTSIGNHLWRYTARDFDLAKAEPLTISFLYDDFPARVTDLFNHRIPPSQYTVEVSGADPMYPAKNLSDFDLGSTTVLRPDKNDSLHIVIRFKKPTPLKTIVFFNGYCKNATVWRNNSRVESMTVDMVSGKERLHLYTNYYSPSNQPFRGWTYIPKRLRAEIPDSFTWQGLTDAAETIHLSEYYYYSDSEFLVDELHFSIATTTRGEKSPDICISEIILLGSLPSSK